tara:strand:+ start:384 stop:1562 length:1179 start_codon:yes stop_codon:yes gene_type:complete
MHFISKNLYKTLKKFKKKKLYLHEPDLSLKQDFNNLKTCIQRNEVSATGSFVKEFEKKISKITGSKYVVSTNSGTSALHVSCILSGITKNDEVLLPAFTFVASANSIIYCQATPHFVDTKKNELTIDFEKLDIYLNKITRKVNNKTINRNTNKVIKAIMVVHPYGQPADCDKMIKIAKKYNLKIIEDAADALGSFFSKKHVGTFGKLGVLSFNGNKIVTCGSGGAILTDDKKLAEKARILITTSKIIHKFKVEHSGLGYNYRMSNINAALGLSQLNRFYKTINYKKKIHNFYKYELNKNYLEIQTENKNQQFNHWLQIAIIAKKYKSKVDLILKELTGKNFFLRKGWELMINLKHLKNYPRMNLNCSKDLQSRLINLPSSTFLIDKLKETNK